MLPIPCLVAQGGGGNSQAIPPLSFVETKKINHLAEKIVILRRTKWNNKVGNKLKKIPRTFVCIIFTWKYVR